MNELSKLQTHFQPQDVLITTSQPVKTVQTPTGCSWVCDGAEATHSPPPGCIWPAHRRHGTPAAHPSASWWSLRRRKHLERATASVHASKKH